MNGLIRKAALTACGLAVAATAFAGVPSPANSTLSPGCVKLVNANVGGVAANPSGTFSVTVRDLANNPIANSTVVLDFVNCGGTDVKAQNGQPHDAGVTQNCAARTIRKSTDVAGLASFIVVGGGSSSGGPGFPSLSTGCVRVIADGVLLATVTAGAQDQNSAGGLTPADVSAVITDVLSVGYETRADLNCSGDLSPADVSDVIAGVFSVYNQPLNGLFCNL